MKVSSFAAAARGRLVVQQQRGDRIKMKGTDLVPGTIVKFELDFVNLRSAPIPKCHDAAGSWRNLKMKHTYVAGKRALVLASLMPPATGVSAVTSDHLVIVIGSTLEVGWVTNNLLKRDFFLS